MRIQNFLKNHEPQAIFACVSGGVDSIAGTHWLINQFNILKRNIPFKIVHFNHGLREQNDQMEIKVRSFAEYNNVECLVVKFSPEKTDEQSLRELRIAAYHSLVSSYKPEKPNQRPIFINYHHLNDAIENYLFNVMAGTPEYVPIPDVTTFKDFYILHPFLTIPKRDLTDYALEHKLFRFVEEDETNSDDKYKRNHVRNVIIPEMNRWTNLETIVKKKFYGNRRNCTIK